MIVESLLMDGKHVSVNGEVRKVHNPVLDWDKNNRAVIRMTLQKVLKSGKIAKRGASELVIPFTRGIKLKVVGP